jgi:hypothetical protein
MLCGTLIHVILTWDFIIFMLKYLNKNYLNAACLYPKCITTIHGLLIGEFNHKGAHLDRHKKYHLINLDMCNVIGYFF